jgi:hypothetical protein
MNNNAKRITREIASLIKELISISIEDPPTEPEICKGGGSNGGQITKLLMNKPVENLRISKNALKLCREHNVFLYDYFFWGRDNKKLKDKYDNFFSSNKKNAKECHEVGHYITADHNIPNTCMIQEMKKIAEDNVENLTVEKIIKILNSQSLDFITIEENDLLRDRGFGSSGTKEQRDALCSEKIDITDVWLTPEHIINQFFETSGLNRKVCLDPCACDGRWLKGEGISGDILPMAPFVEEKDFLTVNFLPENIKYIVGNIPFSLTKEFVEKSFYLLGEAFFLVNGDNIMNKYNGNIKKIWIINGIEGNQKDYRSRCEFETIVLKKSALWCCIVHLTKEKQEEFLIEKDISNEQKRDGFHIALGRNTYIKSLVPVENNERIIRLQTKGTIKYEKKK